MVNEARPHTIITDTELCGVSANIASRIKGMDIFVTSKLDDVSSAKKNKTPVALEVTIGDRKDLQKISQALSRSKT
ncbi:MAG: hypothetical protein AUI93_06795 [Crenarchaeota archaeon 13_1_40CM_3_52_10]|nr:MAG: hypothetical protein AUI93_06795 [Crenarchaeota archaeon 13_1_40CM_3_52_10]